MIGMLNAHQNGESVAYLRSFDQESGRESGISHVSISGRMLSGCKLYWYDGAEASTPCSWEMGMLLRDHEDMGVYKVDEIFLIADAFAEFLTAKQIPFTLFVRHRTGREEIVRAKFPSQ